MPRVARVTAAGAVYHVTSRGNRRQPIFTDRDDLRLFLRVLDDVVNRFRWRCQAYCLLPNHFHLVVETPEDNLSRGMHRLNGLYAQWFNDRHGLDGHLFQGRFHSTIVEREGHLLELVRYVFLNPVRAGLCRSASDWAWSSYRPTIGAAAVPRFLTLDPLLTLFADDTLRAHRRIAAFVDEAYGI